MRLPLILLTVTMFREIVQPGGYVPFLILAPLVAWDGGYHVWQRRFGEDRKLMDERARQQADALHHAVADERARIARELHDVVTHHVSVLVIQAGAARSVLASEPDQARDALLAVESTGRSALTEPRTVMGLLTPEPGSEAPAEPQPGLAAVPALVRRMCDAGLPVELVVARDQRPLSSGAGLAAYRVVQEALTNTVRHAAGATATVTLEYGSDPHRRWGRGGRRGRQRQRGGGGRPADPPGRGPDPRQAQPA